MLTAEKMASGRSVSKPKAQPMTHTEVQEQLRACGTAQNRKVYARHGANKDALYGVSFANINALAKKIKTDQALAEKLWASNNHDARNLATKIADPATMTINDADRWVSSVDNYLHASLLGGCLARSQQALKLCGKWCRSRQEFVCQSGYALLGAIVHADQEALSESQASRCLKVIEAEIHQRPNWARYSMNWALIALGVYVESISERAVESARRIGKVGVDHGQTSCKTPDAASYIIKARTHPRRRKKPVAKKTGS